MLFTENDNVDHPPSLFDAATKKSNVLMVHAYSHFYQLPTTGLRFFTVYGPWGKPDMVPFKFSRLIFEQKKIDIYNYGKHTIDFTYIDNIIEGIIKVNDKPSRSNENWNDNKQDTATSKSPWRIYNIGNNKPVKILDYLKSRENL